MEGFYLTADEVLYIDYQTLTSSVILDVYLYGTIDGKKRELGAQTIPLTADGAVNSVATIRGPGLIETAAVVVASGTVGKGDVAVGARVVRVSGSQNLTSYIAPIQYPSNNYPAQNLFRPTASHPSDGEITRLITLSDPAADTEISQAVPTGALWKPELLYVPLTTDANAANRRVNLKITDGTNTIGWVLCNTDQAASLTYEYTFSHVGGSQHTNSTYVVSTLPDFPFLPAGYTIETVTTNRQATDNFGQGYLVVTQQLTLQ